MKDLSVVYVTTKFADIVWRLKKKIKKYYKKLYTCLIKVGLIKMKFY